MVNSVQSIDHFFGVFSPDVDTMGYVAVSGRAAASSSASFAALHDDSATIRGFAKLVLKALRLEVLEAKDGAEALQRLRNGESQSDIARSYGVSAPTISRLRATSAV